MNSSVLVAVGIGGSFIALTLVCFLLSLVPGLPAKIRDELASWPEQWRDLRADVVALLRRGRHAGTPRPLADSGLSDADRRANARAVGQISLLRAWHTEAANAVDKALITGDVSVAVDEPAEDIEWTPVENATGEVTADGNLEVTVTETVSGVAPYEGAVEGWSPLADVKAVKDAETTVEGVTAAHTVPDVEELTILARFDELVESMRAWPKDLAALAEQVDESFAVAGMDGEQHRLWRATALTSTSGEHELVPA